jgi:hypothetical protein
MVQLDQHDAGFTGELGVEPQHFDCEGDFVHDALAGAVATGEQLQVGNVIEGAVAVDVVDGLFRQQPSADVLFHDVTMSEKFPRTLAILPRDNGPSIAVFILVYRRFCVGVLGLIGQRSEKAAALCATQQLLAIDSSAGAPLDRHEFAALKAVNVPFFVRKFLGVSHAAHGAIQRVSTVFFAKRGQVALHHGERLPALFTGEFDGRLAGRNTSVGTFISLPANSFAEFARCLALTGLELLSAVFANFLDRHRYNSLLGGMGVVAVFGPQVKG